MLSRIVHFLSHVSTDEPCCTCSTAERGKLPHHHASRSRRVGGVMQGKQQC